jgi:hypothetical protein
MLKPFQQDAELSQRLTRFFEVRKELAPGSRVKAMRRKGGKERLAAQGQGIHAVMWPAREVLEREGGLAAMARMLVRTAVRELGVTRIDWVEVDFRTGPGGTEGSGEERDGEVGIRTLLPIQSDGAIGDPQPPLPPLAAAGAPAGPASGEGAPPRDIR